jgi:hypothetical protein
MNAGPADTRSPHLDLGELIAEAAGQPVADRSREHLTHCEHCRTEANRWGLVAGGVRGLAADPPQAAQPARPRRTGQRGPARPWRRAALVAGSAAAALVLLLGIGAATGYVHVHLSGPSTGTALTAVTGCSQLEQAEGTLVQVNGTSLVIKTASGQPVTVTTTASTFVSMSGPLRNDITDGASVMVRGDSSGATIAAAIVTVGQPFRVVNPAGYVPVQGTVADASTAGFTLVTASGSRIRVTTSGATLVVVPHASLGQLQDGTTMYALGQAGPDGTLAARGVTAVTQLPAGGHLNVSSTGCSPAAITALAAGLGS